MGIHRDIYLRHEHRVSALIEVESHTVRTFDDLLADSAAERFTLPASYCLQDGIYGGLVLAVALARIEAVAVHPVRSIHVNFCALARPDRPTQCTVERQRRGSKTESWSFALIQDEHTVAHGSAFSGKTRTSMANAAHLEYPDLPPYDTAITLPSGPPMPPFTQNFEMKAAIGDMIASGGAPQTRRLHHIRAPFGRRDWPAAHWRTHRCVVAIYLVTARQMQPMATTSLHITFCTESESHISGPFVLDIHGHNLTDGFNTESNYLWTIDGKLVAMAHQHHRHFKPSDG